MELSLQSSRCAATNSAAPTNFAGPTLPVSLFLTATSHGKPMTGGLKIRRNIVGFDELAALIRRRTCPESVGLGISLPIRCYYPVASNSLFWILYATLFLCQFVEPFDGQFESEMTFFLFILTPLPIWLVYVRSRRYVCDKHELTYRSLRSSTTVAVTEIRDMWIERTQDEHGPYDLLHFNLPGGEEFILHDGNIGVRQLFEALAPHCLQGDGSRLARTTSVLGI